MEIVFQEQTYSSLHSGQSLAWDDFSGVIDDPCSIIDISGWREVSGDIGDCGVGTTLQMCNLVILEIWVLFPDPICDIILNYFRKKNIIQCFNKCE